MTDANTDFGRVADDLRRAAGSFALLTGSATAFGSSLSAFREFERRLTLTNAIAGGTVQQFNRMSEAARSFSLITTTSANDAVGALQQLAQAGFTAEESLQSMTGVLLLAQATFTDIGVAADLVTSNIRAFGLAASDTGRVANVLAAAVTSSLATVDKLAFAFRQVAPVANLANLSIEETTALLNQLFNVGLRGEQAGTALRNIIIRLVRPLGEAGDILRDYGIATRDAAGNLLPLVDIFNQLREAQVSNAELARIFETEALAGVVTLLSATARAADGATSAYEDNLAAISDTDKALELAVANLSTFDAELKLLQNSVVDLQKSLGEALAPTVISISQGIRSVITTFQGFDQQTKNLILTVGGAALALASLLAVVNALSLVFGGVAFGSLLKFLTLLRGSERTIGGFVNASTLARSGIAAMGIAAVTSSDSLGTMQTSILNLGIAAAVFAPSGPILLGIAAVTAALFAGVTAWDTYANAAERAAGAARSIEVNAAAGRATQSLAELVPLDEISELQSRVDRVRQVLSFAGETQTDQQNLGTAPRQGNILQVQRDQAIDQLAQVRDAAADIAEVIAERDNILATAQSLLTGEDNRNALQRLAGVQTSDQLILRTAQDSIAAFEASLSVEVAGALQAYDTATGNYQAVIDSAEIGIADANELRSRSTQGFLEALRDPEQNEFAGTELEALEPVLREILDDNNVFRRVRQILENINQADEVTDLDVIRAIIEQGGNEEQGRLLGQLLSTSQGQTVRGVALGLEEGVGQLGEALNQVRITLLNQTADTSNDLGEAVRASTEAGLAELDIALSEVAAETEATLLDAFQNFGQLQSAAAQDAVAAGLSEGGFNLESIPGFAELFSGSIVIDAIRAQTDANTTVEEANAIAAAEFEKYRAAMEAIIASVLAGIEVTPDEAAALNAAGQNALSIIEANIISGLNGVGDRVAATAARVETANRPRSGGASGRRARGGRGGGGGGKSAEDQAKEALRDARRLEDAFRDAERQSLRARETFLENVAGLDVSTRIDAQLTLDLESINQDADREIQQLRRKLEDLQLDGNASAELEQQYSTLITQIEAARDAEIAAAQSFEAQMERRSDAIDLFIRDIKNAAFEANSTFTQVAAGIGIAFAEYNRDLVTLVDITSNAVTGFLDTVTSGVSDFIFDNENAFENFKSTMLDISRQIFEGFTQALLQQTISSVTNGGGSLFGNLLQPSAVRDGDPRNSQAPGIGQGGLLGGLFGGSDAGAGGNAQIDAATTQVVTSLNQGAQQMSAAFQQISASIQGSGQRPASALDQSGNQIQQSGSQGAAAIQQAGGDLAGSLRTASSAVASSAGAGGGGGGGLNVGSLFGAARSIFGFAKGGEVGLQSIARYANGGSVVGAGTGTSDDILAFLSNGEFVVNARMAREFMPLLEAINSGAVRGDVAGDVLAAMGVNNRTPAFATGGVVGDTPFGPPSVNLTSPRPVLIERGSGSTSNSSNTVNNNQRGGDTIINLRVVNQGTQSVRETNRSADQLAKRLASQIERAKKNT